MPWPTVLRRLRWLRGPAPGTLIPLYSKNGAAGFALPAVTGGPRPAPLAVAKAGG